MDENLLFIHYPSGGYGFYLARLINRYISGVVKVDDRFSFDKTGTSHSLPLVHGHIHFNRTGKFSIENTDPIYRDSIQKGDYILVPHCPGINDDMISKTLIKYPKVKFLRLCYNDSVWPLIFYNAIVKAMNKDINEDVFFDAAKFGSNGDWARRENFSLLFKSHDLRQQWKPVTDDRICNIDLFSLLTEPEKTIKDIAKFLGRFVNPIIVDLDEKHRLFLNANPGTTLHLRILKMIDNLTIKQDLYWINELFWQAVVNFYIEEKYNFTILVNEYSDWFTNTSDLVKMIERHGIQVK